MKCDHCKTEMKMGKAINNSEEEGVIYAFTPYAYLPNIFMNVLKCPSCGFSLSQNEIERRNEKHHTGRI